MLVQRSSVFAVISKHFIISAPLSACTKQEMRGVVRFLHSEAIKPAGDNSQNAGEYGESCLSEYNIYD